MGEREGVTWSGKLRDKGEMNRSRRIGRMAVWEAIVAWR